MRKTANRIDEVENKLQLFHQAMCVCVCACARARARVCVKERERETCNHVVRGEMS